MFIHHQKDVTFPRHHFLSIFFIRADEFHDTLGNGIKVGILVRLALRLVDVDDDFRSFQWGKINNNL